jgi:hypothetical protein
LVFVGNTHHQLPDAPPPPDDPPPPEKPPPLEYPPPLLDPPELMRIFSTKFRNSHLNPGDTTSKIHRTINAAMRSQVAESVFC